MLIVLALLLYVLFPQFFSQQYFRNLFQDNAVLITILYCFLTLLRALFFIPSTVFVLLGIGLFPNAHAFVIAINMAGIIVGASLLYKAAQFFDTDDFFAKRDHRYLKKVQGGLQKYGFPIVLAWSFFPAVPTDLICYVAGATKMNYFRFIAALTIGEFLLVSVYVYTGMQLLEWIFS